MAAAEVGESYTTSIVVKDSAGTLTDPSTIVLTITLPDQTTTVPTVTHDSTGNYHVDYTFTQEGLYIFQWVTTAPATSKTNYVPVTVFRSIVSLEDTKSYINYDSTLSSEKEDLLRQMMMAVTELIEEIVGTCVIKTFTNKPIPGYRALVLRLPNGPLPSETSVTSISSVYAGGPSWSQANGDFIVNPDAATVRIANFFPFYYGPWKATYTAGRAVISQKIQLAALESLYDLWSTQRPYAMDALEPGPDATARWEMMVNTYKLPPHAIEMLRGEERPGFR